MRVYRVVAERDGATTRKPGEVSVEVVREDYRFAAESMQQVWDATEALRNDPERTLIAIIEEAPAITVLAEPADR